MSFTSLSSFLYSPVLTPLGILTLLIGLTLYNILCVVLLNYDYSLGGFYLLSVGGMSEVGLPQMSEVGFEVSEVTGLQCHGLLASRGEVSKGDAHVRANMFALIQPLPCA